MDVPAILLGEPSDRVFLFVHGKLGCKEEAIPFAQVAASMRYQILSIDLPNRAVNLSPEKACKIIQAAYAYADRLWSSISLRANSIGAWYSMQALQKCRLQQALFVSPVTDMEPLIQQMMQGAGVVESQLKLAGEIPTDFGETLSWRYLTWVRNHPIHWTVQTVILYGQHDSLIAQDMIDTFLQKGNSTCLTMPGGEHWFHTPEQLRFMADWEMASIQA